MKIFNHVFLYIMLIMSLIFCLAKANLKIKVSTSNNIFFQELSSKADYYNISLSNKNNFGYDSNIFIGSLNAAFNMQFDTATSLIWIPSSSSSDKYFLNKFNCSESTTCHFDTNNLTNYIYPQGVLSGYQVTDTIKFPKGYLLDENSLTLPMPLILATDIDPIFDKICTGDGVFGLGLGLDETQSIIDILYNENLIQSRWFSLFLTNDPYYSDSLSELIIQGYDPTYVEQGSSFIYLPIANPNLWSINISNFSIGYMNNNTFKPVNPSVYGILASANSNIGINPDDLQNLWDVIVNYYNNTCNYNNTIGYFCYCEKGNINTFPNITITSGNLIFTIPSSQYISYSNGKFYDDYIYQPEEAVDTFINTSKQNDMIMTKKESHRRIQTKKQIHTRIELNYNIAGDEFEGNLCLLKIEATNDTFNYEPLYQGQWMLGIPLLELYYTIYNKDNMSIGFSGSVQPLFDGIADIQRWLIILLIVIGGVVILGLIWITMSKQKKNKLFKQKLMDQEEEAFYLRLKSRSMDNKSKNLREILLDKGDLIYDSEPVSVI